MTELVVTAAATTLILAAVVVAVTWVAARTLRDELTASRMERAELLQRIQAPKVAVQQHAIERLAPTTEQDVPDPHDIDQIDEEWLAQPESLVTWEDDGFDVLA